MAQFRLIYHLKIVTFLFCFLCALPASALEIIVGLPYGKHAIGHTAVRVYSKQNKEEVIYDFGRYGKTWGYLRLLGEGILRVWRGDRQVARYLAKQQSYRSSIGYVLKVSPAEEERIYRFYETKLKKAQWKKDYGTHTRYRLKRDYRGVDHQCTSFALDSIKHIWPPKVWQQLLDPRFNKGQGLNKAQRKYYFGMQRKLGLNDVGLPLDVVDALNAAQKAGNALIDQVKRYPVGGSG